MLGLLERWLSFFMFVFLWDGKLPSTWRQLTAAPSPVGWSVCLSPVSILLPPEQWIERAFELLLGRCKVGILSSHKAPVALGWERVCAWVGCPLCCGCWDFSPRLNLASRFSQLMENSRGPLKQGRFSSARKLPSQGDVVLSQPSKGSHTHLVYLSHLTSSYQRKQDVAVLCTPVGNTRVKSRLLESAPQKGDLKELLHSLPDAFISDSPRENARYHRKESFLLSTRCLLVCFYVNGVRLTGWVTEGVRPLCSTMSPPPLAQVHGKGKYSSSLILLFMC